MKHTGILKKIQMLLIVTLLTTTAFSQTSDYFIMKRKQQECSMISPESSLKFIEFMAKNRMDLAKFIVNKWEATCGLTEPVYRAKILLALKTGQFNNSLLSSISIDHIFNYQSRMKGIRSSSTYWYDSRMFYYGYVPPEQDFDKYTYELASDLKSVYAKETIEYILAEFYSTNYDSIFLKLQSSADHESALVKEYNAEVKKYEKMLEFHIAGIIGLWIPSGKLTQLGVHPEVGGQVGWKKRKMNYDFTMTVKFLDSPNSYYARMSNSNGDIKLTNYFWGFYWGFDFGRDVYAKKGHEIQPTAGIALDALAVSGNRTILSYNFNFGIEYRYYVRNGFYVGLKVKYNVVDYTINKIIDFNGHPITVHFIVGGVNNRHRNEHLEALRFPLRK